MRAADLRLGDAVCLARQFETGSPTRARSNGLIYLSGIAVEIVLKARLLSVHPLLGHRSKHRLVPQALHDLCWKRHDIEALWGELFSTTNPRERLLKPSLTAVSRAWSIDLRYDPVQKPADEALEVHRHALRLFRDLDPR
jgi:hypothetical protein